MIRRKCIEGNLSFGPAFEAFKKGAIIGKESEKYLTFYNIVQFKGLILNGEDLLAEDWMTFEEEEIKLPVSEEIRRHLLDFNHPTHIAWKDLSPETKAALKKIAREERGRRGGMKNEI